MSFAGSPVEAWYEASPTRIEVMKRLLAEDADFYVCPGWPAGGHYHGHDEVFGGFFPTAGKAWTRLRPVLEEVVEAEGTFVVRGRYEGVASATELPFSCEFVHIWRVKDGRLASLHQVADTAVLADAMLGREPVTQAAVP